MRRADLIHKFFTPEQLKRAREQRKPKPAPPLGVQLMFPLEIKMMAKGEHERRLRNEFTMKGE